MPKQDLDAEALLAAADDFKRRIDDVKRGIDLSPRTWYPYDSFGNIAILPDLLTGERRHPLRLAGEHPVLDVGSGDGDLAFFFETLGCEVHAVDHPATNYNGMEGILALRKALGSSVQVHRMDLDGPILLPAQRYGLGLCLGLLYHIKNPFHLLEGLAKKVLYCLLSTRVAQVSPDRRTSLRHLPVAYLVDEDELNRDCTNFWVFSEAGLRRMLSRAGWEMCDYYTTGCTEESDPLHADERAFCLLRSRVVDPVWRVSLIGGWHELEQYNWRWTEKRFSVRLELERPAEFRRLELCFSLPGVQFARTGPVTMAASFNGVPLGPQLFATAGRHIYAQPIPTGANAGCTAEIEFMLDKTVRPGGADQRELGVVVTFARPGSAAFDANLPLTLIS